MLKLFKQSWAGEAPLAKVFWIVYVLFGLIVIFTIDLLIDIFVSGSFTPFYIHNKYTDMIITLFFPYLLFSSMCVWICGKNSWIEWNILSKISVIIPLIYSTFHITRLS
jgi:hypothetical protein